MNILKCVKVVSFHCFVRKMIRITGKNGDAKLYTLLEELDVEYPYYEHPPAPVIEKAIRMKRAG